MGFNFTGGLKAYQGYEAGRDAELARQHQEDDRERLKADRAYQDTQRQFQTEQQNRARTEWGKQDALQTELAGISDTEPKDVQLRKQAAAMRKAGKMDEWLKLHQQADTVMWDRSARKFQGILASSAGKTPLQLLQEAQQIYNSESGMPVRISNVRQDGGAVVVDLVDTETNSPMQRRFTKPEEVVAGIQALADPKTYAATQQARMNARIKAEEAMSDPSKRFQRVGNSVFDAKNETFKAGPVPAGHEYIGDDANGNPTYRRIAPGSGGAGAGAGAGKGGGKPVPVPQTQAERITAARGIFDSIVKNAPDDKMAMQESGKAHELVDKLITENAQLPPAKAAKIALTIGRNPNLRQPALNPLTGQVDLVYRDDVDGLVTINRGIADGVNIDNIPLELLGVPAEAAAKMSESDQRKIRKEKMRELTSTMLAKMDPQEAAELRKATFSPAHLAALRRRIEETAQGVIAEKSRDKSPAEVAAVKQVVEDEVRRRMQILQRMRDLMWNYTDHPNEEPERGPRRTGGIAAAASAASKYLPPPVDPLGLAR